MRLRYIQLGEQRGIGATMHVLETIIRNFVLFRIVTDCGVGFFRGPQGNNIQYAPLNYLQGLRVDLIIITHAHMDHIGAMPRMVAEHPEAQVLISAKTLDGGTVLLEDGLRIQKRNARDLRRQFGKDVEIPVIYDDTDLESFLNNENLYVVQEAQWVEYQDQQGNTWNVGLCDAGHDQGAMSVLVKPPDLSGVQSIPVFLTGDISSTPQNIVGGAQLPKDSFLRLGNFRLDDPNLVLITEGTNGNREVQVSRKQLEAGFIDAVLATTARGGTTLIHTFSRGRSSDRVLALLNAGIWPIHVAGMSRLMVAKEVANCQELIDSGKLIFVDKYIGENPEGQGPTHLDLLAKGEDPCGKGKAAIIVSPSATLDQGPASGLAAMGILENPNNSVISVGHRFPDTVAARIANMQRGHTIPLIHDRREVHVNVRCDVHHFGFSGHDSQTELADRIQTLDPRYVIVHHAPVEDDIPVGFQGLQTAVARRMGPKAPHMLHGKHNTEIIIDAA